MKRPQLHRSLRWPTSRYAPSRIKAAFTLLELVTAILILAILVTLLLPAIRTLQARAERARCMTNLRNLVVATNLHVQEKGSWPQIDTRLIRSNYSEYGSKWIEALRPYGLSESNWICPTTQKILNNPDLTIRENLRVDYTAMPFDTHRMTPYKWPKHPWFVEHSSVHGNGNLLIVADGSIHEVNDYLPKPTSR